MAFACARPPRPPSRPREHGARCGRPAIFEPVQVSRACALHGGMHACAAPHGMAGVARRPASRDIRTAAPPHRRVALQRAPTQPRACTAARRRPCLMSVPEAATALESSFFEARTAGASAKQKQRGWGHERLSL